MGCLFGSWWWTNFIPASCCRADLLSEGLQTCWFLMTQLSGSPFGFNKIINPYLLSSGHNQMRKRRKQTTQASFFTLQTLLLIKGFSRACLLFSPDIQFYFPRLCLNVGDMREMLIWGDAWSGGKRGRKWKELRQDQTSSEDDVRSERVFSVRGKRSPLWCCCHSCGHPAFWCNSLC